jgi:membrane-bound metal-dependent hydrolase YbcI (DUF457 family)
MIAGHFGFAAAIKSFERQTPLWALMLACVWLDVVFVPLFLAHIETIRGAPGTDGGYGTTIIYADYTHSLCGALAIAIVFGAIAAIWWSRRTGFVLAAIVFSHWLLDLLVHRADMPILPGNVGNLPRLGFGLWRYPVAAAAVEAALVLVGAFLYWRAAQATVSSENPSLRRRANLSAFLVLVFGIAVLVLDFTRILG